MSLESPLGLSCADENTVDNTYIVALQQSAWANGLAMVVAIHLT